MKEKKKILGIGVVVIVLLVLVGFTYAYFLMTDSQSGINVINSACLSVSITKETDAISLTDASPITDVEGQSSSGYTFTITNSCDTSTNYQINLESINYSSDSLGSAYIKTSIQKESYGSIIKLLSEADADTVYLDEGYEAHKLYTGVIDGNSSISFNLRLWVDYDATVEQAGSKEYQSKIVITANSEIVTDTEYDVAYTIDTDNGSATATVTSDDTVLNVTYCTTDSEVCSPSSSSITLNSSGAQMICSTVNGSSEIYCSEAFSMSTLTVDDIIASNLGNGTNASAESRIVVYLGDVNADGEVTDEDYDIVLGYVSLTSDLTDTQMEIADYNNDDAVDINDAVYIQRLANGYYSSSYKIIDPSLDGADAYLIDDETLNGDYLYMELPFVQDFSVTATTDEGMYAALDNDGVSFYYRGATDNNYVYFAGFYWRIIRVNGDGSIRLIYQGTTADAVNF